jgi:DNA-binding transcriptional regulator GbsR (MarR family)
MKNQQLVIDLADSVGGFIEYWGFKKVHGQVWLLLFLSKDPLSSRDIRERLGISKALLSITLNELKAFDLVYTSGKGVHGVELFDANEDFVQGIINVIKRREAFLISNVLKRLKVLHALSPDQAKAINLDLTRLKKLEKFTRSGQKALNGLIKLEPVSFRPWRVFSKKFS